MDFDAMYSAITGRDARFDGVFFTAVRSTGIYCRPSCPATRPRRENVEFHPTAAACQQAGFRACRRCVPEALPGSPAWSPGGTVVARALQLVADGVVDDVGVDGLAARLGHSSRQLNRLLVAETGASALAYARARRAQLAHGLVTSSDMPLTDVAFTAGFGSVRQFNDTMRAVYGVSPSELRGGRARRPGRTGGGAASPGARGEGGSGPATPREGLARSERAGDAAGWGTLRASLSYRPPFDWAGLLDWFAVRALPGIERVSDGCYTRSLSLLHGPAVVELGDEPRRSRVLATFHLTDLRDLGPGVALVRRLLDLDADPVGTDAELARRPWLVPLVAARPGIRLPGSPTPHEALLRAITGQQVSVVRAQQLQERLVATAAEPLPAPVAGITHLFPTPAAAGATADEWWLGPASRRDTVHAAMALAEAGGLDPARGADAVAADLLAVPGIGPWTVAYTMLRGLQQVDVDLAGDGALLAVARREGLATDPRSLRALLDQTRPWRSYASLQLWAHSRALAEPTAERTPG